MAVIVESNIHLQSFSFKEEKDGEIELDIQPVHLSNLDLFIGNNAQGKSRLFRTLKFIKELVSNNRKKIGTDFEALFEFDVLGEKVIYSIKIIPSNENNTYIEEITRGTAVLLSTKDQKLFDETSGLNVDNFFVPQNVPLISAIIDPRFNTIKLIREFFLRMLFIDADKFNEVSIEQTPTIINSLGTNLAGVLSTWKKNYPHLYEEAIEDLKRCFPIIDNVKLVEGFPEIIMKTELLALNERGINKDIKQTTWSNGMLRTLCLICLPKTPFIFENILYRPSLICIDEIENGLDFNTLEIITDYLKDYSDNHIQILMSSHSPLMGKFIHPRNWQIVKRKGTQIRISKPKIVEPDLEEKLDLYRQEYWDFYTNYVSRSSSYDPE